MDIMIYNTLTRQKEKFTPQIENKVSMYVCGPTVYNLVHIGNARVSVFFDVVRRYFEHAGYEVRYVQNITDVDDKIISAAKEEGVSELEISRKFTNAYANDLKSLRVFPSHVHPKVSEHIPQIISFIQGLIEKGLAYEANGDVYYRVEKFKEYGKLTNQSILSLRHTDRELSFVADYKENDFDFALWKNQKETEIAWDSPWGRGRPGWHIECSAMSRHYLGDTFDIHGGGLDLCFPHHENEIAQSEGLTGVQPASVWMHNNYVTVDGAKMSKSVGNFTTVREALEKYEGESIRMFFLSVNYRNPIDYSEEALFQADSNLKKLKNTVFSLQYIQSVKPKKEKRKDEDLKQLIESTKEKFHAHMHDDFNTSDVVTLLLEFSKIINTDIDNQSLHPEEASVFLEIFKEFGEILGFDFTSSDVLLDSEIQKLVEERDQIKEIAKLENDKKRKKTLFEQSDEIRNRLEQKGILLEDTPYGTRWKKNNL